MMHPCESPAMFADSDDQCLLQTFQGSNLPRASSLPKCARDWTEPRATISAMHLQPPPEEIVPPSFINKVFVHPPSKFAFCSIAKVGITGWTRLQNKLLTNRSATAYGSPERSQQIYGPEGVAKVFNDPGATRMVMLREPLARFASAFLDKCFKANCGDPNCRGIRALAGKRRGQSVSMEEAVQWMMNTDPTSPSRNNHWRLQSSFCELKTRLKWFTIVGVMQKERLTADSSCAMEVAGLQAYNHVKGFDGPPLFGVPLNPSGTLLSQTVSREEDVLKRLFTTEAARKLIKHFAEDYTHLRFESEPSWVADATGEWYNVSSPHGCHTRRVSLHQSESSLRDRSRLFDGDADDVVRQAFRAKYPLGEENSDSLW